MIGNARVSCGMVWRGLRWGKIYIMLSYRKLLSDIIWYNIVR